MSPVDHDQLEELRESFDSLILSDEAHQLHALILEMSEIDPKSLQFKDDPHTWEEAQASADYHLGDAYARDGQSFTSNVMRMEHQFVGRYAFYSKFLNKFWQRLHKDYLTYSTHGILVDHFTHRCFTRLGCSTN